MTSGCPEPQEGFQPPRRPIAPGTLSSSPGSTSRTVASLAMIPVPDSSRPKRFPQARVTAFFGAPCIDPRRKAGEATVGSAFVLAGKRHEPSKVTRRGGGSRIMGLFGWSGELAPRGCGKSHRRNGDCLRRGGFRRIPGRRSIAADVAGPWEAVSECHFHGGRVWG